jgi:hypothetical protein
MSLPAYSYEVIPSSEEYLSEYKDIIGMKKTQIQNG